MKKLRSSIAPAVIVASGADPGSARIGGSVLGGGSTNSGQIPAEGANLTVSVVKGPGGKVFIREL